MYSLSVSETTNSKNNSKEKFHVFSNKIFCTKTVSKYRKLPLTSFFFKEAILC